MTGGVAAVVSVAGLWLFFWIFVATNGVERLIPRVLPFAHDGYGQDIEWVAPNFMNAVEILETGYLQWVDTQVGEGLTNGLYKLTVAVPERPLETTELSVGDYSVAVTNAGEYVFLLGKGVEYPIHLSAAIDGLEYERDDGGAYLDATVSKGGSSFTRRCPDED